MNLIRTMVLVPVAFLVACGTDGRSRGTFADFNAPIFNGVKSIATAGGAAVRLGWDSAQDETASSEEIRYRIYFATATSAQDFEQPIATTEPGATSIVLTGSDSAEIKEGVRGFYVVRAVDTLDNEGSNDVELAVRPVPAASVAFVSDAASGAGMLGDSTAPFASIQAGVEAVESNGGGIVLVDAAAGGSTYAEEINLTGNAAGLGMFGGFSRFSSLPLNATGRDILTSRNLSIYPTWIAQGALPGLADNDLMRINNAGVKTDVDGFQFSGEGQIEFSPLTGVLEATQFSSLVTGVGTLFTTELQEFDFIRFAWSEGYYQIYSIESDTEMYVYYSSNITTGSGSAEKWDPEYVTIRAIDSDVQLSGNDFSNAANVMFDTSAITAAGEVRIVGNEAVGSLVEAFQVGGGLASLRFQNNRIEGVYYALSDRRTATGAVHVADTCEIWITHNQLTDRGGQSAYNSDLQGWCQLSVAPADPDNGSDLALRISDNQVRNHSGDGIVVDNVFNVGDGGSVNVDVQRNFFNGTSRRCVYLGCIDGDPFADVDVTINCSDNTMINNNNRPIEVVANVSAGSTTTIDVRDNFFGITESEIIYIISENGITDDLSDGGKIVADIHQNVTFGGTEDIRCELGIAHRGSTTVNISENNGIAVNNEFIRVEAEGYFAGTTQPVTFPDGIYRATIFNNYIESEDPIYLLDERGTVPGEDETMGIFYVGHNTARAINDGSDGAVTFRQTARSAAMLIERNFTGGGGQDTGESGVEVESEPSAVAQTRILNNVALLSSGGGISIDPDGPGVQVINNTASYNGQNAQQGLENIQNDELGDLQSYFLNCITSHNGGGDADVEGGVRPSYSLIQDQATPSGIGNLSGDPLFRYDVTNLNGISNMNTAEVLPLMFTLFGTSPAIDAGHPDPFWNDADSTRNDMGAYGGKNAGPVGVKQMGQALPFVYVGTFPSPHLYTGNVLISDTEVLRFAFSKAVDVATIPTGIRIRESGIDVAGAFTTEADGCVVVFTPATTLTPNGGMFVDVDFDARLLDASGHPERRGRPLDYPWRERIGIRPAAPGSEVEPNDDNVAGLSASDFTSAQSLGVAPGTGVFELASTVGSNTDLDVYSITVEAGDRLQATILDARLAGGGMDGAIHLDLHSTLERLTEGRRDMFRPENGAVIGDAFLDHTFLQGGTYFLVVSNPDSTASPQTYNLLGVLDR